MHPSHQQPRKFRILTNYLPVPEKDVENPPDDIFAPSSASIIFWKYAPFGLHFALTAIVAAVCLFFVSGHAFNTNFRRPEYVESDGTLSRLTLYAPLQSDIATAISLAATATRVAGGWWGGGYLWRSVFVSMERGGISLEGLSRVASNMPPAPRHFERKSNMAIISLIVLATYAIDYFSAVLNGAIIWEPTYSLVPGRIPVQNIARGVGGQDIGVYFNYTENRAATVDVGTSSANLAWGTIQPNSTYITEPSTISRRVVKEAGYLPTNSTLDNITMPYFAVDAFNWIKDPDSVLDLERQHHLFESVPSDSEFNPYISGSAMGGLLPDNRWGPPEGDYLPDPHTVSETRLLTLRTERRYDEPCPQSYLIDGLEIKLHQFSFNNNTNNSTTYDCHAIANVTYRAGAALCQNCKIISAIVVEAQAPLTLIPDPFTSMALGLAPSLGTHLIYSGYAVPQNDGTRENYAIEMISRTYHAAWAAYSSQYGTQHDDTAVKIALPTLRAKVFPGKVFIWVALHLGVLAFGLLFVFIQSRCDHPWAENPTMALFWLDTSAVSGIPLGSNSDCIKVDPWRPGTKFRRDGMLTLEQVVYKHHTEVNAIFTRTLPRVVSENLGPSMFAAEKLGAFKRDRRP